MLQRQEFSSILCAHGRPGGRFCPHCYGFAVGDGAKAPVAPTIVLAASKRVAVSITKRATRGYRVLITAPGAAPVAHTCATRHDTQTFFAGVETAYRAMRIECVVQVGADILAQRA